MDIVDLLEYSERAQLREWFEHNAASEITKSEII